MNFCNENIDYVFIFVVRFRIYFFFFTFPKKKKKIKSTADLLIVDICYVKYKIFARR